MSSLTLVIANKNYSSWSLRVWLAMTEAGIPFTERQVKFDSADWVANIATLSPTRLVPVLWEGEPDKASSPSTRLPSWNVCTNCTRARPSGRRTLLPALVPVPWWRSFMPATMRSATRCR